ncbi:MAG: hypothetical protein ABL958_20525 [Bdellovibrionia bacterium]
MKSIPTFAFLILTFTTLACSRVNFVRGEDLSTDGSTEKIDVRDPEGQPAIPGEPATGELSFTGDQINIDHQLAKPLSTIATFQCNVQSISFGRPFVIRSRFGLLFDFTEISQVDCDVSAPANSKLKVHDAAQANINVVLAGADLEVTNVVQTGLNLAIREGVKYRFDLQALQIDISGFNTCARYTTTSETAPAVRVKGSLQIGIRCYPEAEGFEWSNPNL